MKRLTWLVGPPGAGKSTYVERHTDRPYAVEFTSMLGPLVDSRRIRKGVLQANAALVQAVRSVELHPENAAGPPVLVVAGLVPESALFPLSDDEEVLLLLPPREQWRLQLRRRPSAGTRSREYDDYAYSETWYDRFEDWVARELPVRRLSVPFDANLIGRVARR